MTSSSRSCGRAWAVIPSRPVIVVGGDQRVDDRLLGRLDDAVEQRVDDADRRRRGRRRSSGGSSSILGAAGRLPVANAMNRSPLVWPPVPPARAIPSPARWARRSHWWGSSGASVATTTMIEPEPGGGADCAGRRASAVRAGDLVDRRSPRRPARRRPAASRACRSWPGPGRRPCSRRARPATTRDAVPIPPLNSWQTIPVPPPTSPSATGPPVAEASAARDVLRPARGSR